MSSSEDEGEYNDPIDFKKQMKALKKREKELTRKADNIESMMKIFTQTLAGSRPPPTFTSTGQPEHVPLWSPEALRDIPSASSMPSAFTYPSNTPYSRSYIRDALELVPKYDGHNIAVWQFARACKRAKESVPLLDEAHLVRSLRNKLTGHAYLAVEDEVHLTMDKFLDTLKRTFGSGRTANYYRGQLSIIHKKPAEHILDYIGRIKDLRTAIIEGDQTNFDRQLTESEIASIDALALESFYEGLPREYRVELRAEGYTNFADACAKVIIISKRLEREEAREKQARASRTNQNQSKNAANPQSNNNNFGSSSGTLGSTEQKICSYCKRFGHLINECRTRHQQFFGKPNRGLGQRDIPRPRKSSSHPHGGRPPFYVIRNYTGDIPSVEVESPSFCGPIAFMVDTGAHPNIIKKGCVHGDITINNQEILQLTGITENAVSTLGSIEAHILETPVKIHVVPDEFPMTQQGILGTSFFKEHDACIDYAQRNLTWRNCYFPFKKYETIVVPPRTNTGFVVLISNPEIKTGYIPRLKICEGVYAGDSLVTCINDKAYIRIINTLDHEIEVLIPTLRIEEVAQIADKLPTSTEIEKTPLLNQNSPKNENHKLLQSSKNNIINTTTNANNYINKTNVPINTNGDNSDDTNNTGDNATNTNTNINNDESLSLTNPPNFYNASFECTQNTLLHAESMRAQTGPFHKKESATALMGPSFSHKSSPSGIYSNPTLAPQSAPAPSLVPCRALPQEKAIHNMNNNQAISIINTKEIAVTKNKKITRRNIAITQSRTIKPNEKFENSELNKFKINPDRVSIILQSLRLEHLTSLEQEHIVTLVENNSDRFYIPNDYLGQTHVVTHKITTTDDVPIHTKQYRFPPIHKDEINRQVNQLRSNDIIVPSNSPYNSPVWIVPKKSDSTGNKRWRMVIDYRRLNEKTIGDAYPLPNICDIMDQLGGSKYMSILDLISGFHQIPMDPADAHKTAFSTPHGHYEFSRMPFGLKNAPATFQRLMDQILTGLQGVELFVYMDDIVVYASSLQEHEIKMNKLMDRLRSANLVLQPDKCEFLRREVAYLGHIIGENGVRPDPQKISAVQNFPVPKNIKNVRQFLGLAGYYRRFIPNFSKIANPLSNLLKKDVAFKWNDTTQEAFNTLKELLCKEPILQYPDFNRAFVLTTDASNFAIGGVLSQGEIGHDLPIAYASRVLNSAEKNYSTIEKELLAITYCVNHFRPYLYGRKFTLVTDHQPLTWLHRVKDPTSRLARWRLKLEEYDYDIVYKKGTSNNNADALSRNPVIPEPIFYSVMPIRKKPRFESQTHEVRRALSTLFTGDNDSDDERPRKRPILRSGSGVELGSPPDSEESNASLIICEEPSHIKQPIPQSSNREFSFNPGASFQEEMIRLEPSDQTVSQPLTSIPSRYKLRPRKQKNIIEISSVDEDARISDFEETPPQPDIPPEPPPSDFELSDSEHEHGPDLESLPIPNALCKILDNPSSLLERNDHLVVLTTVDTRPFDNGAIELHDAEKLPILDNLMLGRARVYLLSHCNDKHVIILAVKERKTIQMDIEILKECFASLLDVITELNLQSISVRKTEILDSTPWRLVLESLTTAVAEQPIIINICHGLTTPLVEDRINIIKEHHESAIGGHKGITKTYRLIRKRYFWPDMKNQIQNFVKQCLTCQTRKLVRQKTRQPMMLTDTPGQAFDKVALDIVGPLKTTDSGNTYILTMQDLLTKYSVYAPLSSISAEATATAFINYFICRFGCPRSILTDQGRNFMSQVMKSITKKFRIQHFRTTAYYPQSNGSLERSHSVLIEYLKCFVQKENEWDIHIERASFSYNTSVHEGTGYTPHELIFGTPARIPSSYNTEPAQETYSHQLNNLFHEIRGLQQKAKLNLEKAKQKSKQNYDKRVKPVIFQPGDNVFLLNDVKTSKFTSEYLGPYRVLEVMDRNVTLEIRGTTRIVHSNKLKKAYLSESG
ncbi:uncharacterized protein LOC120358336 [Solenopsis invicta]|uniref:uncharacterized protein LOC120358336 n=1 Tax=Solenopsis invicta TaxID=13686 RepID=UPI00193DB9A0|nr:uncharacterized protein LOC120358336 [Solenopsis invicta]